MTTISFENFADIKHIPLRVFNRVVYMQNLMADFGIEAVKKYIEQFAEHERQQMFLMQAFIKSKGVDEARRAATRDLKVVYDAGQL